MFEKDVHIRFQLLDVAPMVGDVKQVSKETPLALAADILVDLVNGNKFVIMLDWDSLADVSSPPFIYLFVCLFIYLFVYLFICLFVCLFI